MSENIVITGAARTPMGGFQGVLSDATAAQLGASAISASLQRSRLETDAVGEVIMGCVLPAGQGQAPARQASLGAGLSLATGCTTVNKMCGSGMKADDAGARPAARGHQRRHGCRRYGKQ